MLRCKSYQALLHKMYLLLIAEVSAMIAIKPSVWCNFLWILRSARLKVLLAFYIVLTFDRELLASSLPFPSLCCCCVVLSQRKEKDWRSRREIPDPIRSKGKFAFILPGIHFIHTGNGNRKCREDGSFGFRFFPPIPYLGPWTWMFEFFLHTRTSKS